MTEAQLNNTAAVPTLRPWAGASSGPDETDFLTGHVRSDPLPGLQELLAPAEHLPSPSTPGPEPCSQEGQASRSSQPQPVRASGHTGRSISRPSLSHAGVFLGPTVS